MDIKKLFCVLFITVMLLSVPCAYATEDSSENNGVNEGQSLKSPTLGNAAANLAIEKGAAVIDEFSPTSNHDQSIVAKVIANVVVRGNIHLLNVKVVNETGDIIPDIKLALTFYDEGNQLMSDSLTTGDSINVYRINLNKNKYSVKIQPISGKLICPTCTVSVNIPPTPKYHKKIR